MQSICILVVVNNPPIPEQDSKATKTDSAQRDAMCGVIEGEGDPKVNHIGSKPVLKYITLKCVLMTLEKASSICLSLVCLIASCGI